MISSIHRGRAEGHDAWPAPLLALRRAECRLAGKHEKELLDRVVPVVRAFAFPGGRT